MNKAMLCAIALFAAGMPAQAQSVDDILAQQAIANDKCRGGSGDDQETWGWCGVRDAYGVLLEIKGWCRGKEGQSEAEMEWHECGPESLHTELPEDMKPE